MTRRIKVLFSLILEKLKKTAKRLKTDKTRSTSSHGNSFCFNETDVRKEFQNASKAIFP